MARGHSHDASKRSEDAGNDAVTAFDMCAPVHMGTIVGRASRARLGRGVVGIGASPWRATWAIQSREALVSALAVLLIII